MKSSTAIPYGFNPDRGTFPAYRDNRHLLTFGPTRSGKGATVIVQALLQVPHSVICIDPKGQNAAITARARRELGQRVFVLNPFALHMDAPWRLPRHRFNPLAHLRIDQPNVVADVGGLAEALIISEGKEPFFTDAGRDLVRALLLHLIETKPGTATLADLRRLISLPRDAKKAENDLFFQFAVKPMMASKLSIVKQTAAGFAESSRTTESVRLVARTQTTFLDDPNLTDPDRGTLTGSDFAMLDLKHAAATVYLIIPALYMDAYARFFRLVITSALDQLTSKPGGHPTLLLLDEFATLQNLGAIKRAYGFAAGFNVQCWSFLQDLPQLKAIYGEGGWESFLANAGLVQFFTPSDMTTADYMARRGGEYQTMSVSSTLSGAGTDKMSQSETVSEKRVPHLRVEEALNIPANEQVVFFSGVHLRQQLYRQVYWRIDRLRGLYDPDPYHV